MPITLPLSASFGYGILLGLGFAFAFGMMTISYCLKRYHSEVKTSEMEMFSTAGRTVKPGLVACAVVSSWTWAATLLQSSGVAYRYGVSGPCKTSSAHYFLVQVDWEHRDIVSVLLCFPRKNNADLEKYNSLVCIGCCSAGSSFRSFGNRVEKEVT